jgi:Tfp pilus assembly protein PilF
MQSASIIHNLEKLLSEGKESALLRFSLGNEYLKLGEKWVAVYQLRRALELDPTYSAAWKVLGNALSTIGANHAAMDAYRQGIAVAERRGDKQAAKEMAVFVQRLEKKAGT